MVSNVLLSSVDLCSKKKGACLVHVICVSVLAVGWSVGEVMSQRNRGDSKPLATNSASLAHQNHIINPFLDQ